MIERKRYYYNFARITDMHIMNIRKYIKRKVTFIIADFCSFSFWSCSSSDNDVERVFFQSSNQYGNTMAVFGGLVSYKASLCREYWVEKLNLKIANFAIPNYGFAKLGYLIRDIVDDVIENYPPFLIFIYSGALQMTCHTE